jgi:hypothetical protein
MKATSGSCRIGDSVGRACAVPLWTASFCATSGCWDHVNRRWTLVDRNSRVRNAYIPRAVKCHPFDSKCTYRWAVVHGFCRGPDTACVAAQPHTRSMAPPDGAGSRSITSEPMNQPCHSLERPRPTSGSRSASAYSFLSAQRSPFNSFFRQRLEQAFSLSGLGTNLSR